jgi:hypothetical protein
VAISAAPAQRLIVIGAGVVRRQAEALREPPRDSQVAVLAAPAQRIIVAGTGIICRQAKRLDEPNGGGIRAYNIGMARALAFFFALFANLNPGNN